MLTRTAPRIVRYDATDAETLREDRPPWRVTWLGDMLTPDTNSFGVLRLVFAAMVLVSHTVYLATGQPTAEPLYGWTNYTLGQHGVQLFFILSGILVAQSLWQSRSVRDYATARTLRILPALVVCVLVTALFLGPWLSALPAMTYLRESWVAAYIVKTTALITGSAELPGLFADNPAARVVNSSVWTLKYEVLCYTLLAMAGLLVLRLQAWRIALAGLLAAWLVAVLVRPVGLELHGGPKSMLEVLRYFALFCGTGVAAFVFRRWIPVHGLLLVPLGLAFWVAIGTRGQEPAAALFLGYGAIWLSTFTFGPLRAYTHKNDYSYGTYLYHMPVTQALLHLYPEMPVPSLVAITAGVVLILAFLSWELVERPALAYRHSFWQAFDAARRTATAAGQSGRLAMARAAVAEKMTDGVARVRAAVPRSMPQSGVATPAQAPSAPPAIAPGTARVWRPMPQRRRLDVDGREAAGPTRDAARPRPFAMTARRARPSDPDTIAKPSPAAVVAPVVTLSGARLSLALNRNRPAAAPVEPAEPVSSRAPSRAVVALVDPT